VARHRHTTPRTEYSTSKWPSDTSVSLSSASGFHHVPYLSRLRRSWSLRTTNTDTTLSQPTGRPQIRSRAPRCQALAHSHTADPCSQLPVVKPRPGASCRRVQDSSSGESATTPARAHGLTRFTPAVQTTSGHRPTSCKCSSLMRRYLRRRQRGTRLRASAQLLWSRTPCSSRCSSRSLQGGAWVR